MIIDLDLDSASHSSTLATKKSRMPCSVEHRHPRMRIPQVQDGIQRHHPSRLFILNCSYCPTDALVAVTVPSY